MGFIALEGLIQTAVDRGLLKLTTDMLLFIYPIKIAAVVGIIYIYRKQYVELAWKDLADLRSTAGTIFIGLLVFLLWINLDFSFSIGQPSAGFDPTRLSEPVKTLMTITRIFGAIIVVPVMEELFWRSFLIRYICDNKFSNIPIGHFTWPSFIISALLFGLEHQLILAGIVAGIAYNMVVYKTKSIAQAVLAHSVTNLALAVYVISKARWDYW